MQEITQVSEDSQDSFDWQNSGLKTPEIKIEPAQSPSQATPIVYADTRSPIANKRWEAIKKKFILKLDGERSKVQATVQKLEALNNNDNKVHQNELIDSIAALSFHHLARQLRKSLKMEARDQNFCFAELATYVNALLFQGDLDFLNNADIDMAVKMQLILKEQNKTQSQALIQEKLRSVMRAKHLPLKHRKMQATELLAEMPRRRSLRLKRAH